jgi:aspartate/methionine/tyrosine aminotransferase
VQIAPFALERYFARYEFTVRYLASCSDCDGLALEELLALADDETCTLWRDLRLGYTESLGHPLLRAEIASLYEGAGADDVLTGAPEELIFLAMNCLLEPGDHVIATFPGYQALHQIAESMGCEVTRWQPDEGRDWLFDPDFVRANVQPRTKLIVANFPHNPTGALPSRAVYDEVVAIARERGIHLFSDEMYRGLELQPAQRLPAGCEAYDRAVSLAGMSKVFGLAGTRIGWLVAHDGALFTRMAAFKDYTTICSSAPSEILALMGLRARDRIVARHVERIGHNLALLARFLERHADMFTWVPPRAGTICFPRLLHHVGAELFCRRAVEEAGVMIVPSSVFGWGDRHVRIGLGRAGLPEVLAKLEDYLASTTF